MTPRGQCGELDDVSAFPLPPPLLPSSSPHLPHPPPSPPREHPRSGAGSSPPTPLLPPPCFLPAAAAAAESRAREMTPTPSAPLSRGLVRHFGREVEAVSPSGRRDVPLPPPSASGEDTAPPSGDTSASEESVCEGRRAGRRASSCVPRLGVLKRRWGGGCMGRSQGRRVTATCTPPPPGSRHHLPPPRRRMRLCPAPALPQRLRPPALDPALVGTALRAGWHRKTRRGGTKRHQLMRLLAPRGLGKDSRQKGLAKSAPKIKLPGRRRDGATSSSSVVVAPPTRLSNCCRVFLPPPPLFPLLPLPLQPGGEGGEGAEGGGGGEDDQPSPPDTSCWPAGPCASRMWR